MKTLPRGIVCLMAIITCHTFCRAEVTKLPADDQKKLFAVSQFQKIHSATNLPPTVFALCADRAGRLADPGQKWEGTDFVQVGNKLPTKRLIWAFSDGNYYVVHYERGGYVASFHVMIVTLKEGEAKPSLLWRGVAHRLTNYSAFLEALRSGKLDDRLDHDIEESNR